MNNVIAALCGTVNFMPPWIMLGVFGAIILLIAIIIALKGVKRKFFRVLVYVLAGLIPTSRSAGNPVGERHRANRLRNSLVAHGFIRAYRLDSDA